MKSQCDDPAERDHGCDATYQTPEGSHVTIQVKTVEIDAELIRRWTAAARLARPSPPLLFLLPSKLLLKTGIAVKSAQTELTQRLLSSLVSQSDANALLGDLDERHKGRKSAGYWRQFVIAVIPLVFAKAMRALRLERIFRGI